MTGARQMLSFRLPGALFQMRAVANRWGGQARLQTIHSLFGHDALLKEVDMLAPMIGDFLEGKE